MCSLCSFGHFCLDKWQTHLMDSRTLCCHVCAHVSLNTHVLYPPSSPPPFPPPQHMYVLRQVVGKPVKPVLGLCWRAGIYAVIHCDVVPEMDTLTTAQSDGSIFLWTLKGHLKGVLQQSPASQQPLWNFFPSSTPPTKKKGIQFAPQAPTFFDVDPPQVLCSSLFVESDGVGSSPSGCRAGIRMAVEPGTCAASQTPEEPRRGQSGSVPLRPPGLLGL